MALHNRVVVVSRLEVKEKKRGQRKERESEFTIEVIIPPLEIAAEHGLEEEVIKKVKRVKVPLLVPYFHVAKKITEKISDKRIHLESKSIVIRTVGVPKLEFQKKSDITIKPYKENPIIPVTQIHEIMRHLLNNIPEVEFKSVTDCKVAKTITIFTRKLETLSDKIHDLIFVPRIIFRRIDTITVKRYLKDLLFEKTAVSAGLTIPSDEVEKLEFLDPIQTIFGSGFKLNINRPAIILARKPKNKKFEYVELLKRILREIYRIHGKGLPRPAHMEAIDFDEIKLDIRADKHVWVLDLDKVDVETRYLKDRLKELYSQNLGFLVFYGSEEKLSKVKEILKIDSPFPKYYEVNIKEDDIVFKLAQVMWGIVRKETPVLFNLDATVVRLEDLYFDEIERLASKITTIVSVEPSSEDEENIGGESILHYALKAFVVEYLKRIGVREENIRTEYEFVDGRLDVYVRDSELGELAVEIETLYGTGLPMLKLRRRIESRLKKGLKLWIIIPNPQLMIYFKDILALRNIYRKRYGDKIEFFGVDFGSRKIIPITELLENLINS
ncbi:hypothetical protein [Pyrodictium occultum]|uniref:hypothetical protein n=1 Tax=Pyrodictium occultum TaxID=2309 RepID=UPI00144334D1|nr:hypothetical protein [Pyrodictium occultum]